jgi:sugar phosphate isomerase/epimerase
MAGINGPAVFLAQFLRDTPPFNTLEDICKWFADLGYTGVQIPGWNRRVIDIDLAATSATYCDELRAKLAGLGLSVTEVPAYLAGQVLAIHPAYDTCFASFHPPGLRGAARTEWAAGEVRKCIDASAKLGLRNVPVLSGGFAWHMVYPWPQRPPGLIDEAFKELARRWRPLLDYARDRGCVIGYELHPGSDIYDGATFETFLDHMPSRRTRCRARARRHERAGRFRSLGDGQVRPSGRVGVYGSNGSVA